MGTCGYTDGKSAGLVERVAGHLGPAGVGGEHDPVLAPGPEPGVPPPHRVAVPPLPRAEVDDLDVAPAVVDPAPVGHGGDPPPVGAVPHLDPGERLVPVEPAGAHVPPAL